MRTHEQSGFGPFGQLALHCIGKVLPLQVLRARAGYYLGTCDREDGPVSRESEEYFATEEAAARARTSGAWTQRHDP